MAYRKTGKVVAQLEANRARILDAARVLVFEGGFQAASVAAVAGRAGVATGTLYRYFASREALLLDVFRAISDVEMTRLEAIAAGPGRPADRLRDVAHGFVSRAVRGARQAYALLAEPVDGALADERMAYRRRHAMIFERLMREAQAAGDIAPLDAHVTAAAIAGAIPSALTLHGPDRVPDARSLVNAVLRMSGLDPHTDDISHKDASHDQSA
ncbi:TetR/AcrR family transcriptional regulator [Pyruvatibacter sp.]|uniref:TetR/AcrR family transcriptional regulator n=1 Tax=Pyruvatibacter sp. TaxID=1981328 RepID=UPI0032EC6834